MNIVWVLPIVNALAFLLCIFFGKSVTRGRGHVWTIPAAVFSWVVAMVAFVQNAMGHDNVLQSVEWFNFGAGTLRVGVTIDGFTTVMAVVVTTISLMVQIYSIAYMRGEIRYVQYFATLSLFTSGMLTLIVADSLFLAIFGWEIMGLCSYLLIGHYFEERANSSAGIKAFLTTRTGDLGLLIGTIICFWAVGTFNIQEINEAAISGEFTGTILLVAGICLFIGAMGKSAQFPLHTWLPDAMAGPTPVSALIHAATMVVAGVYLLARMFPVFVVGFDISGAAPHLIVIIGSITAIIGALLALVQFDIKKVLAYSTISQLGFMVFAIGVGAWPAAVFHLFTHAFFKALLFLGSGSVIHAVHEQDMRKMGGLRHVMRKTYGTWLVGTLALCGVFPLAGFFSKDEILSAAFHHNYQWVWAIGLSVAFLTAFYMFRATHMVFHGKYRGDGHPHESEALMTTPLILLAIPSALVGFLGMPGDFNVFSHWAEPHLVHEVVKEFPALGEHAFDLSTVILAVASVAVAGLGIFLATWIYLWKKTPGDIIDRYAILRRIRHVLVHKYYLDHLYGAIVYFIREPLAQAVYWTNQNIIDATLNVTAAATVKAGLAIYAIDQKVIDTAYNESASGANKSGRFLRRMQTGQVQQYAGVLFAASCVIGVVLAVVV